MNKKEIIMFINKHNTSISLILIAIFGGIVAYGLVSYYYSFSFGPAPYTGFVITPKGVVNVPESKLSISKTNIQSMTFFSDLVAYESINDIYLYNIKTLKEQQIAISQNIQNDPVLYQGNLVWLGFVDNYPQVFYQDVLLTGSQPKQLTSAESLKYNLSIYTDTIVWDERDKNANNPDIYLYDLKEGKEKRITFQESASDPAIFGNYIVWKQASWTQNGAQVDNIILYNISLKTQINLTNNSLSSDSAALISSPNISANYIVWEENSEIYLYDINTQAKLNLTNDDKNQSEPSISGNNIAWNQDGDIYYYDIAAKKTIVIASGPAVQDMPQIHGSKVIWHDSHNIGIHLADLKDVMMPEITSGPFRGTFTQKRSIAESAYFYQDEDIFWSQKDQGAGIDSANTTWYLKRDKGQLMEITDISYATIDGAEWGFARIKAGNLPADKYSLIYNIYDLAGNTAMGQFQIEIGPYDANKVIPLPSLTPCQGDLNCDGKVNETDKTLISADFGRNSLSNPCTKDKPCKGDLNCDLKVDATDINIYNNNKDRKDCPVCDATKDLCSYCQGDLDNSGAIDEKDWWALNQQLGRSAKFPVGNICSDSNPCSADLNCNQSVGADDVTIFNQNYGKNKCYKNTASTCVYTKPEIRPIPGPCYGDIVNKGDNQIDLLDLTAFMKDFTRNIFNKPCGNNYIDKCAGDFDCDADVDANDLGKMITSLGRKDCPSYVSGLSCQYPAACHADINGDQKVSFADWTAIQTQMSQKSVAGSCTAMSPCTGDYNCDGKVDNNDFQEFKAHYDISQTQHFMIDKPVAVAERGRTDCPKPTASCSYYKPLTSPVSICDGDVNGDGLVDTKDTTKWSQELGAVCTKDKLYDSDIDCNGRVDSADAKFILNNFGRKDCKPYDAATKARLCPYASCQSIGDTDCDGDIDIDDQNTLLKEMQSKSSPASCINWPACKADLNCDGKVNTYDLGILQKNLGTAKCFRCDPQAMECPTYPLPLPPQVQKQEPCYGDFNNDNKINAADETIFNQYSGRTIYSNPCNISNLCMGDFDCDGDVDATDINKFTFSKQKSENNLCASFAGSGYCATYPAECKADLNCDRQVNEADKTIFNSEYSAKKATNSCTNNSPCVADLDCDGNVDLEDQMHYFEPYYASEKTRTDCPICLVRQKYCTSYIEAPVISVSETCAGDLNCDGKVNAQDSAIVQTYFGRSLYNNPCTDAKNCGRADIDCNGSVDSADATAVTSQLGKTNCLKCADPAKTSCVYSTCKSDFNCDGFVNSADEVIISSELSKTCSTSSLCKADLNCDGKVDANDVNAFNANKTDAKCKACAKSAGEQCSYTVGLIAPICYGDFNCDGKITSDEQSLFNADYGRSKYNKPCTNASPCKGDFDCDGDVDATDTTKFNSTYGRANCPASSCITCSY